MLLNFKFFQSLYIHDSFTRLPDVMPNQAPVIDLTIQYVRYRQILPIFVEKRQNFSPTTCLCTTTNRSQWSRKRRRSGKSLLIRRFNLTFCPKRDNIQIVMQSYLLIFEFLLETQLKYGVEEIKTLPRSLHFYLRHF